MHAWDAISGDRITSFIGHGPGGILRLEYSADGRILTSGSRDDTVRMWNARTGSLIKTFTTEKGLTGMTVAPDGTRLTTSNGDGQIAIHDIVTGAQLRSIHGHSKAIMGVAVSPDGHHLVSVANDNQGKVWLLGVEYDRVLRGHNDAVVAARYSRDGQRLVSTSLDGTARIWDPVTGEQLATLPGHNDRVYDACFNPSGTRVATAGRDSIVRVFDASTGAPLSIITTHTDRVNRLAFSHDGRELISACGDGNILAHDPDSGESLRTISRMQGPANAMCLSGDGHILAVSSGGDAVYLLDARTGDNLQSLPGWGEPILELAMSPDGRFLAAGTEAQTVRLWDRNNDRTWMTRTDLPEAGRALAFDQVSSRLFYGDSSNIRVLDLETCEQLLTIAPDDGEVVRLTMSPDGRTLISSHESGTMRCWDASPHRAHLLHLDELTQAAPIANAHLKSLQANGLSAHELVDTVRHDPNLPAPVRRMALNAVLRELCR